MKHGYKIILKAIIFPSFLHPEAGKCALTDHKISRSDDKESLQRSDGLYLESLRKKKNLVKVRLEQSILYYTILLKL